MENMTNKELMQEAKTYDKIQNDGGEGFNPYAAELAKREIEARRDEPKTKQDAVNAIHDKIRRDCGSVAIDAYGVDTVSAKRDEYYAGIEAIEAEIKAEEEDAFKSEWTPDVTACRRKEWNNFASSIMDSNGMLTPEGAFLMSKKCGDQGWGFAALKKAIKLNNL